MVQVSANLSTGLPGLDKVLRGLIPGDNLVWQIDSVEDYLPFAKAYCQSAKEKGHELVYFRFACHEPIVEQQEGVRVVPLQPQEGCESFIANIHQVINEAQRGTWYLFDCLSELSEIWYSDTMMSNFFMLTCPYLFDVGAIAYFGVIRRYHSADCLRKIMDTAQVWLDIYRREDLLYVHPIKVQQRHSPTMYMLHVWENGEFSPVADSATIAEVLSGAVCFSNESNRSCQGIWDGTFRAAEELLQARGRGEDCNEEIGKTFEKLLRMVINQGDQMLGLARQYLSLEDIIGIGRRIIGTGLIGGKSVGMLLSRAILQNADAKWSGVLEAHDTFYIGSDVFYSYLVQNGLWWKCQKHRDPDHFLEGADRTRQRILLGTFSEKVQAQFQQMLDYFGQSPIIVRSSSLLEDNFGHSFAGKYESIFLANQGGREQRLQDFISAVRTIYSSTMSEDALSYRARRGMLARDEQMALLVQRVSGLVHDHLFYPHMAGVGFSYNPYVWSQEIEPDAGVLRLVFGLGTRAVDRTDDDYTRLVALNAPEKRPVTTADEVYRYAQRRVDLLDLNANQLVSKEFEEVVKSSPDLPLELLASRDETIDNFRSGMGRDDIFPWMLTFEELLNETDYVETMRELLHVLQEAYGCPVDMEFTTNFRRDGGYKINIVQCRPLALQGEETVSSPPEEIPELLIEASGAVIGRGRVAKLDNIVLVVPSVYGFLPLAERYSVARIVGKVLNKLNQENQKATILLMGPGRWGTSMPWMGVPVTFGEINRVNILGEVVVMHNNLIPDVSLGTHFFNELVETDILYFAVFPEKSGNMIDMERMEQFPNRLTELLPDAGKWEKAVRVISPSMLDNAPPLIFNANTLNQRVVCYPEQG